MLSGLVKTSAAFQRITATGVLGLPWKSLHRPGAMGLSADPEMTEAKAGCFSLHQARWTGHRGSCSRHPRKSQQFFRIVCTHGSKAVPEPLVPKQISNLMNKKTKKRTEGKTWTQTLQAPGNFFLLMAQGIPALKQRLSGLTTASLLGKQVFRPAKDLVTDTKSF